MAKMATPKTKAMMITLKFNSLIGLSLRQYPKKDRHDLLVFLLNKIW